jgi:O-acetyl-ADP-ribose deacetylase (regulator of RNase III)
VTVEYCTGDLFEQGFTAYAHGANCAGRMGAGVAREFRRRWPGMYDDYRQHCQAGLLQPGSLHYWTAPDRTWIVNLATQDRPGKRARLDWVRESVTNMLTIAEQRGMGEIGMPRIGAGIGGLAWANVATVLEDVAGGSAVRLVVVSLPGTAP